MAEPFEHVVTEFGPVVARVCRAVLGEQDADDAWAETFLAALRAYPDLPPGTNMQAWLVTVAHRKAIDQYRARIRRPVPTAEVPDYRAVQPEPIAGAYEQLLAGLPDKQRLAVVYHHLAGLPYAQVAALLGNSEAAARRAAADGIAALRRALH
jgi:RNA polymerase sigma factor (sigma-70 family)